MAGVKGMNSKGRRKTNTVGLVSGPPAGPAKDYVPTSQKGPPRKRKMAGKIADELDIDVSELMAAEALAEDEPEHDLADEASRDAGVKVIRIAVPVGAEPMGYCQQNVDLDLDARQAAIVRRIGDALVLEGARLRNGRNVAGPASVLIWLLEEVAHKLEQ